MLLKTRLWLDQRAARRTPPQVKKFGWFGGVFTPDVLTILGVIMYLRLTWVVGNAGLVGAVAIILLAKSITLCTGLSISSITTNIRIGAGGAYSIISKSLGLEAGGSVGIPLYIAQTLSAALYIIGFTEGWLRAFPTHPGWVVSIVAWALLLTITYISADFAIRTQYLIMGVMALSLLSFLALPVVSPPANAEVIYFGSYEDASFWHVFAVFFPAVTGIMAGTNMSGDLENPRRDIPLGTMSAIGVTLVIYLVIAVVAAWIGTAAELRGSQMFLVDHALVPQLVIAGILGATFSSALGSMLGAPRLLQAIAENRIVPFHGPLAVMTATNNPRNATMVTGLIILVSLLVELDTLAVLITMFFLITYGVLNLVVFIQQTMKIISFRPTLKIPRLVSLYGALGSLSIMLLIDPIFSLVAFITIVVLYVWLIRRQLAAEWGDIRGGMFLQLAESVSRIADKLPRHSISWKPDLLVPIEDPRVWSGSLFLIRNITAPTGSIFAFTITRDAEVEQKQHALNDLLAPLKPHILVNSVVIEEHNFFTGARVIIQTLRGGMFRPNTLFLTLSSDEKNDQLIEQLTIVAARHTMGVVILHQHPRMAFGMQQTINLWLRDKSPNWHLAILLALHLQRNWDAKINLITATEDDTPEEQARLAAFLRYMSDETRMQPSTCFHVLTGPFVSVLNTAPRADLNIFGLAADEVDINFMRRVPHSVKASCLFVKDSGYESALV